MPATAADEERARETLAHLAERFALERGNWEVDYPEMVEEVMAMAYETTVAARTYRTPFWIAWALAGYGRAFTETDPARAQRLASGARLHPRASAPDLGGAHRTRRRHPRGGPRRP